jgi:hypothetical protein
MKLNPWVIAGGVGAVLLLLSRKAITQAGSAVVEGVKDDLKIKRIVDSAEQYNIPPAVALAIADVESGGGSGFAKDGRMIIRFEPHIFRSQTKAILGDTIEPPPLKRGGQAEEWAMFDAAVKLNREAALKSISMGMFQVMGFNHKVVGYPNVEAMFSAYSADQKAQIQGFFEFCTKVSGNESAGGPNIRLDEAARKGNFLAFARGYNGKGQQGYDTQMKKRYDVWVKKGYKGIDA